MNHKLSLGSLILLLAWSWAAGPVSSQAQIVNATIFPDTSTNLVGSSVSLTVTPDVELGFDYQWTRDGTNLLDSIQISGSTTPTLTLSNLQLTDTATYRVSLSLTGTVLATAVSTVYVVEQPAIQSVVPVTTGGSITFTANATGGLLSYQWTWQGQPLAGATNSVLVFNNALNDASAGVYSVGVTNPVGAITWSGPGFLFTKPTPSGTYQGIFFDTNSIMPESSGFFQYTLTASKRSFSGKLSIGANSYPFTGVFSLTHESEVQVLRRNSTPLSIRLQLVTTNDAPQVFGTVSNAVWQAFLRGNRLYFSARTPTVLASKYTVSFLNTNIAPQVPAGSGYGTVTIRSNGTVVLIGQAADGTPISQTCGLSRTGDWPLYVSMFKGRGRLIGWLNVSTQLPNNIQGDAVGWVKGPGPEKLYPNGFGVTLQPVGSTYLRSSGILPFTNGVAAFTAGDLFFNDIAVWDFVKVLSPRTNVFVAEPSAENLKLTLSPATGIISGQFTDVLTGLRAPIKAVVLPNQGYARGYFISTNSCGSFTFTPGTTVP